MKTLLTTAYVKIPEGGPKSVSKSDREVKVEVKSRSVRVKGPRGTLQREFKHLNLQLTLVNPTKLRVDAWFSTRKVW